MKSSVFTLAALAGLFTTAFTSTVSYEAAIAARDTGDTLDSLTETVLANAAAINETAAGVSDSASEDDKDAAAEDIAGNFDAITAALSSANTAVAKRGELLDRRGACNDACVKQKCAKLSVDLSFTIKFVHKKIGYARCQKFIKPCLTGLVGFLTTLDKIVVGLLVYVGGLVNAILFGVAVLLDTLLTGLLGGVLATVGGVVGGLLGGLLGGGCTSGC